ncbi:hypothetical protein [Prevotella intermedia]|uniref:DUF551 domain-containing protein n=1 Tax=Prevotella intermedia TaxID=28131 RepID=A0A2A6EFT9_PREIN|nr:hypothetical protein [Prevotella intermedia]PDP60176.1 hypothetical protein CLI71_07045 [Prevotella intermedia]
MERKIIESGTTLRWHNSKEELPNLKDRNDTLMCLVNRDGNLHLNVWNQYYQVWDDEYGDDYEMNKETELEWFPLETMKEGEIIKL